MTLMTITGMSKSVRMTTLDAPTRDEAQEFAEDHVGDVTFKNETEDAFVFVDRIGEDVIVNLYTLSPEETLSVLAAN